MSDEQLAKIDSTLDRIETRLGSVESKIDAFGTKFDSIDTKFAGVDARFTDIDSKFKGIDSRFDQLGAELRALNESTRDEIKLVAEGQAAHREETARGFEAVRKELADGLAPLSDAVRHHTAVLKEMRGPKPRA